MFNLFFATYEATDPPPIITPDYKAVKDNYERYLSPHASSILGSEDPILFDPYNEDIAFDPYNGYFDFLDLFRLSYDDTTSLSETTSGVVDLAKSFVGSKYTWGGSSPLTGFDCSGFVQYVYKLNGIDLPRTAKEMEKAGSSISLDNVQPGDLITSSSNGPSGKHVKLVSKVEDGQIWTIDARGKKKGVVEEPLKDTSSITSIRRIIHSNDYKHKFGSTNNKFKELVDVMTPIYKEVLLEKGISTAFVPYLIKLDALESNYGLSPRGNGYNLGGIKGKPESSTKWSDGQYYRNFKDLKEYASYKVDLLNNRYGAFLATSESDFIDRLHGKNRSRSFYSLSYDKYKNNFRSLISLEKYLNVV